MIQLPNVFSRPFPKDWGLIIGIENYDSLPDAKFAHKEAQIIKNYFVLILGVSNNLSGKKALKPMRIMCFIETAFIRDLIGEVSSISLKNRANALLQYEIHKSKKGVCP